MKREKMIGALTVFCAIVLALSLFLVIEKSQNLTITRDVSIEEIGIGEYMVNVIRAHKDAERASTDVSGRGLLEHRFFYYFYEEDNRIYLYTVDEDSRVNGIFHLERQNDVVVDIVSVEKDFALAKEELFELASFWGLYASVMLMFISLLSLGIVSNKNIISVILIIRQK